ncbi:hypothetical protein MKK68_07770 [Methylobacterium sp. E-016]|uniref:hypothetical protein n=1 Tax=Methylobacterium sp. E-016 TaxID=2836556 RepID=UPI001FB9CBFF|nr:hypothetical protein [Methylobacterium sp. E-016]MCJ2075552.1 hypothetical protein [Methylobacterium sp. E-016]
MFTDPNSTIVVSETENDKPFQPFVPSTASRKISLRSKGSMRGSYVDVRTGRQITYESRIEKDVALNLMTLPGLIRLEDQPAAIPYIDIEGTTRSHTFDFKVHLADGRRIMVVVKDQKHAEKKNIARFLTHLAPQIPKSIADGVILYTEAMLSPAACHNARLIQTARRIRDAAADATVAEVVAQIQGQIRIGEIVRATRMDGAGFHAVVRLIARRRLTLIADDRIGYGTFVAVVPGHTEEVAR